jgi:hypothetical protein
MRRATGARKRSKAAKKLQEKMMQPCAVKLLLVDRRSIL